jgi:hypothetical protein
LVEDFPDFHRFGSLFVFRENGINKTACQYLFYQIVAVPE